VARLVGLRSVRALFFPERAVVLPGAYALIALIGIAAGVLFASSNVGQRLEWMVYDQYSRRAVLGNEPAPGLLVVAIDDPSFTEVGLPWPWPRSLHAHLVDQLVRGGARSIAFDIVFDAPPANPEDDQELAEAIGRAGNVILAADRAVVDDRGYSVSQWNEPRPVLAQRTAAVGSVQIPYDPDRVLRRAILQDHGRPSLALAIASRTEGFALPPGIDVSVPTLFRYNGSPRLGVETVSYYQALDASRLLPPQIFKDKHVLIGRSLGATIDAPDHFETPVALNMPGVEVHATIVDALLRHRFIADPFGSLMAFVALSVASAALVAAVLFFLGPAAGGATVILVSVLFLAGGYLALSGGVHVPVVGPTLAIVVGYAFTAVYRFALVTRERRMIRRAFQHYVAPAIVDEMLADPSKLRLGGVQHRVTVLFTDLEGFTTLAERVTPAQLSAHLGEYFKEMLDVLLPQHGTLDKLIGDSIMMYFGCPIPDPEHAQRACRGALAMQARMAALNDRWTRQSLPALRTRIGINTGEVVAGNMGTDTIFNYTIIGDCVNLASRLEGVNKEYGTSTILGEDTWTVVHDAFETRELDWVRVKGRGARVTIYELVAGKDGIDARQREAFRHFADGLQLYRQQRWDDAEATFRRALDVLPEDGPSRTFSRRCADYRSHPPAAWDGVHVMH
jgi:adenylate cyclase